MVLKKIILGLGNTAIGVTLAMMLLTVGGVIGRYLFNSPIQGATPISETFLVYIVAFTLAYTQLVKRHIRMEMLLVRLRPKPRDLVNGVTLILALFYMGLMIYATSANAYRSVIAGEYETGLINVPLYPGRIALALGCLIFGIQYVVDTIGSFRAYRSQ